MVLERDKVRLEPYKEVWAEWFEEEARRLRAVFGEQAPIEHIGSTAIPGMTAKPIIDMGWSRKPRHCGPSCGSRAREHGLPLYARSSDQGRDLHSEGPDSRRTHYLHVVPRSNMRWHNTVLFRNYLRVHPTAWEEYADLKRKFALLYLNDRASYTNAKASFVADILRRATR